MARAKVSTKRFSISEISARRMSCRKCTAHIATLRVEVSTPATTWAGVGEEALQRSGADGRPDESFDDGGVLGIEGMQVRIGLPFLEQELHLPAQAIGLGHFIDRVALGREVGGQVLNSLVEEFHVTMRRHSRD